MRFVPHPILRTCRGSWCVSQETWVGVSCLYDVTVTLGGTRLLPVTARSRVRMASLSEAALPLLIGTDSPVEIDFSELRPVDVAEIELTGDTLPE